MKTDRINTIVNIITNIHYYCSIANLIINCYYYYYHTIISLIIITIVVIIMIIISSSIHIITITITNDIITDIISLLLEHARERRAVQQRVVQDLLCSALHRRGLYINIAITITTITIHII